MNYFAKRNYARGQQKKEIESTFNKKTKGFTKSQYEDLLKFQLNYESKFQSLRTEFEQFLRIDNDVMKRAIELAVDAEFRENERRLEETTEELKKLHKYKNATFLQKFDDEYGHYKRFVSFKTELEGRISAYNNLDYPDVYQKYLLDSISRWRSSKLNFVDEAFREVHKRELGVFEKKFALLCVNFTPDEVPKFDESYARYHLNPERFIFHFRPVMIPNPSHYQREIPEFKFKFNYFEKWKILRTESKFCVELIKKRISKISKQNDERNLRALASEKTERQRSVANTQRSKQNYMEQKNLVPSCPYCQGVLGSFSGKNAAHLDHIHPVSKGGLSTTQNLIYICAKCNIEKSDQTLNSFIRRKSLNRDKIFEILEILEKDF